MESTKASEDSRLDIAYKYPFLRDSKELLLELNPGLEPKFLEQGRLRLEEALSSRRIRFHRANLRELKYAYLISYVYARMLASALGQKGLLLRYIDAESRRSAEALEEEGVKMVMAMAKSLDSGLSHDGNSFSIGFEEYLKNAPSGRAFSLPAQELSGGRVSMEKRIAIGVLRRMMKREISNNLPIPRKELPREALEYAKKVKVPQVRLPEAAPDLARRYAWIGRLLSTPIPDVRHRTVNLILAPYLVNIMGMPESEAAKVIVAYIERCKEIEPNTKVNQSYIMYQCRYAKSKGMKPLSFENAMELLGSIVNMEELRKV